MYSVLQVLADGNIGGGATVVLDLSRHVLQSGGSVSIATQAGSYVASEAQRNGIPVLELEFGARRRSGLTALALARHLRRSRYSVVHSHGARSSLPVVLLPAALRPAMVCTIHGLQYRQRHPVVRELARRVERFCIRGAAETAFVSHNDKAIAQTERLIRAGDVCLVIRNGSPHAAASTEPAAFDIAYLGRLAREKNPMILLDILLAVQPLRPSLCLIGGGGLEPVLRQRVAELGLADQVTFCGALPHAEAMHQLQRARVLILPSRWEGLPMSVIEAMHRGMPVLASNVGGTAEAVVDGETGFLVEVDDVAAYADRLLRLLQDDNMRRGMGRRALQRARGQFALEWQMSQYLALYQRAIGPAKSGSADRALP